MLLRRARTGLGERSPALLRELAADAGLLPSPAPAGASVQAGYGFAAAAAAAAGPGAYYLFRGSRTTPPCAEDAVTWAVLAEPAAAEFDHLRTLRLAQVARGGGGGGERVAWLATSSIAPNRLPPPAPSSPDMLPD